MFIGNVQLRMTSGHLLKRLYTTQTFGNRAGASLLAALAEFKEYKY